MFPTLMTPFWCDYWMCDVVMSSQGKHLAQCLLMINYKHVFTLEETRMLCDTCFFSIHMNNCPSVPSVMSHHVMDSILMSCFGASLSKSNSKGFFLKPPCLHRLWTITWGVLKPGNELAFLYFLFPHFEVCGFFEWVFGLMLKIRSVVNTSFRNL